MSPDRLYVFLHSPLVGPLTWSLVADQLGQRGLGVLVPALEDSADSGEPYWKQHATSVGWALRQVSKDTPLTLVAHSGAGPLLPAVRESIPHPIHAYVFADAGIPRDGLSRLELMRSEDPAWADEFQQELEQGALFPTWSFDQLQEVIPDQALRHQMVAELRPRGMDFFKEPIPVFGDWPDAPCIYIQFSPAYDRPAAQAEQAGWLVHKMRAGHFHMLVEPAIVADTLVRAVNALP